MTELRNIYLTDPVSGRMGKLDGMTDSFAVIDHIHHEIHDGDAFHVQNYNATVGAGGTVSISFKTPSGTKRAHMIFSFASSGSSHLTIAEGATWTTNTGTVVAPTNQLREASPGASMLLEDKTATPAYTANGVLTDATASGAGTSLRSVYIFAGAKVGGDASHDQEIILKPDETYTISVTNDEVTNQKLILHLDWYEHTDKI